MPLLGNHRTRKPTNMKEARTVAEDPPPTNNGVPEEPPARQDVDVLLDVSELEVDRINLEVEDLRAHASIWRTAIEIEYNLHREWFDRPENAHMFRPAFREYIAKNFPKPAPAPVAAAS